MHSKQGKICTDFSISLNETRSFLCFVQYEGVTIFKLIFGGQNIMYWEEREEEIYNIIIKECLGLKEENLSVRCVSSHNNDTKLHL